MRRLYVILIVLYCPQLFAQEISGTIRGKIMDIHTEAAIPFANIGIVDSKLNIGTVSNESGKFKLQDIPPGRYSIQISFLGYETLILNNVLVGSINDPFLEIKMKENAYSLEEVVVRPKYEKEEAKNRMALVSARQLNMEEANRFAGGFDDPARLVSSFAGIAPSSVGTNSFSVRGNSPKGILWQIEGVPVPNPNHFGEITGFGGGGITALSSKTIDNSDFFTGAFPAEYGNALSSVFDLSLRTGNPNNHQHSLQVGFFGLDVASEGPIDKRTGSSYLFNYRYSTLSLLGLGLDYQDLSFKINLPTPKAGTFSIWGLGLIDAVNNEPDSDTLEADTKWQYYDDIATEDVSLSSGIAGLTHRLTINDNGFLKTSLSASANNIDSKNSRLDSTFTKNYPLDKIHYTAIDYRLASVLNYKFGSLHNNRTGILLTNLNFEFDLKNAEYFGTPLKTFAKDRGSSSMLQAYSQSSFTFGKFQVNPGLHFLHFALNMESSIEPRLAIQYELNNTNKLSLGYGLHSQIEKLSFYLADIPSPSGTSHLNTNLKLTKSHHIVLAYDRMFSAHTHLRIEPYYQYIFNAPVVDSSYFSMLNLTDDFFINEKLVNEGTGTNLGLDITLERFLHRGIYYLMTLSIFDSKYVDGNGVERSTAFDREFIANFLLGKEWKIKDRNLFSANVKYTYLGGNRIHPVNEAASLQAREIIEDYTMPYSIQNPGSNIVSFTLTYRRNKKKFSELWSLQMLNVSGAKEYLGYQYNFREHKIESNTDVIVLPNLSYRIEF